MSTATLSDAYRRLLMKMYWSQRAAIRLDRLPKVWGVGADDAAATLAELQDAGLVDIWERGPGAAPHAVLSTLAAEHLNIELSDLRRGGFGLFWSRGKHGVDPGPPAEEALTETDLTEPDRPPLFSRLVDPKAIDPAKAAVQSDQLAHPASRAKVLGNLRQRGRVPTPTVLIGLRLQWPTHREPGEPCPGCGGRTLKFLEACVCESCDRSGNEALLEPVKASERPRPATPTEPKQSRLAGGVGADAKGAKVKVPRPKPKRKRKAVRAKAKPGAAGNSFDLAALRKGMAG